MTTTEITILEAPTFEVFTIASAENLDQHWIAPSRAAGGNGYNVDIEGKEAAQLAHPYAVHPTTTLPDGTVRIHAKDAQLAKLVADGVSRRAATAEWQARVTTAPRGASSLDCRDAARGGIRAARLPTLELAAVAVAGKRLRVTKVMDDAGEVIEVRLTPIR